MIKCKALSLTGHCLHAVEVGVPAPSTFRFPLDLLVCI